MTGPEYVWKKRIPRWRRPKPLLPVVLTNGLPRWQTATQVADRVESVPVGLEQYCSCLRYLRLDEGAERVLEGDVRGGADRMSPLILVLVHAVWVYGHANREEIEAVLSRG